jgi:hypothetical protein
MCQIGFCNGVIILEYMDMSNNMFSTLNELSVDTNKFKDP